MPQRSLYDTMAWYTVKSSDTRAVMQALNLTQIVDSTWPAGLDAIYSDFEANLDRMWTRVLVVTTHSNWTLLAGWWAMSHKDHVGMQQMAETCTSLSSAFGEAQNFGLHSHVDYFQWALAKSGTLIRTFEYLQGEVLTNTGTPTSAEAACGWHRDSPESWRPTPIKVLELARQWSVDPRELSASGVAQCQLATARK